MNVMESVVVVVAQSTFPLPTLHFQSLTESNDTLTQVARQVCEQVQRGDIDADAIQVDTIARCYTSKSTRFLPHASRIRSVCL